ncbi:MAG TPA: phosphatase PAP2 family protein [Sphingobacteriaceae bacterium]|nr:phosphatase PAP2 family protein [Sphingobacteriaceae bacterium]
MPDFLIELDQNLFFAINNGLSNSFFDWIMPILRNRYFWVPVYLFMIIFFIRNYGKTGVRILIFLAITFTISDFSSSSIIKPSVKRLRPCNDSEINTTVKDRIACGTGYSMPSSHASNHFAMSLYLILIFYKRWKWILPLAFLWAALIGFAQIYVGVHYPFDILAGAILGSIIAYITATIFNITLSNKEWNTGNS